MKKLIRKLRTAWQDYLYESPAEAEEETLAWIDRQW